MLSLALRLLRTVPRLLNQFCKLCWLVPRLVSSDERIVRAIYSPYHYDLKKKRLKPAAYNPSVNTYDVSVMRIEYIGEDLCKQKALSFENPSADKKYQGFSVLRVERVRSTSMDVIDSRESFCGHADIKLQIADINSKLEPNEPPSAIDGERLKKLKEALLEASKFFPDTDTASLKWTVGRLEPPNEDAPAPAKG
jgi:hypothetical protein